MGKMSQDIPVQEEDDAGGALSCGQMTGAPTGHSALSLCPCGQEGPVTARRPGRGGGGQNPRACRLSQVPHPCLSLRIQGALSNRVRHLRGARSPDQTSASARGLPHQEMWGRGPKLFQITGSSRGAQIRVRGAQDTIQGGSLLASFMWLWVGLTFMCTCPWGPHQGWL